MQALKECKRSTGSDLILDNNMFANVCKCLRMLTLISMFSAERANTNCLQSAQLESTLPPPLLTWSSLTHALNCFTEQTVDMDVVYKLKYQLSTKNKLSLNVFLLLTSLKC